MDDDSSFLSTDESSTLLYVMKIFQPSRFPTVSATSDTTNDSTTQLAISKDITLNPTNKTFIRLFRPRNPPPNAKIPLIIYFHGGGFLIFSNETIHYNGQCNRWASKIPALVASLEYRLAPEYRLPAAYEDAMDAIMWIKNQALGENNVDPWMNEYCDFSRVFLMGCCSGGNMVYHTFLRALDHDLNPLKIVGLIINQPFFSGLTRTESELKYHNGPIIPLYVCDMVWSLALPVGADRGHEYCDPMVKGSHDENISRLPVCLVRGWGINPLLDKQKQFAKMLETCGVHVIHQFSDSGYHGIDIFETKFAEAQDDDIRGFVCSVAGEKSK